MRFLLDYKLFESVDLVQKRAGIIPYIIESGEVKMLFFIPSDPAYGGDKFQIAKGRVDQGEEVEKTAIREAEEELGLKKENIKSVTLVGKEVISGMDNYKYDFYLYVTEVYNREDFDDFGYETGEIGWLTMDEYEKQGRKSQLGIVRKCYDKIIKVGYKDVYKVGDIILLEYWYNDMITVCEIVDIIGRKYKVSHNIPQSKIKNAPDEIIKKSDIIDRLKVKNPS